MPALAGETFGLAVGFFAAPGSILGDPPLLERFFSAAQRKRGQAREKAGAACASINGKAAEDVENGSWTLAVGRGCGAVN